MAKLTQEKINKIIEIYNEVGTYSGTAARVGCSPATVKKYVMAGAPVQDTVLKEIIIFSGNVKDVNAIDFGDADLSELSLLSDIEKEEIRKLWEEI